MKIKYPFLILIVLFFLSVIAGNIFAGQKKTVRAFKKHCSACHNSDRIYNIEKTTTGWSKTVNWMRKHAKNVFSKKEAQHITQHIIGLHPDYSKELFQTRCSKCHSWQVVEKLSLSKQQWHDLVLRERTKSITEISLDEAKDIAEYLAKHYSLKNSKNKPEPIREMVEKKCIRCHIHTTVFKPVKTVDQWIVVNKRMQQKSPQLIRDDDVLGISEYLSKVNPLPEWQ